MHVLMLTLVTLELSTMQAADPAGSFEERTYAYTGGEYKNEVFKYRLLRPESVEPGKKYPVVLFLHGAGERGADNRSQLNYLPEWMAKPENRKRFPCFLIAPQCRDNKSWAELEWNTSAKKALPGPEPTDLMKVAMGMLDEVLEKCPADRARVYLTGLSMGGYGSWDIAARRPELFAAVVPVCGGGDETKAERLAKLPIWVYHGGADPTVPVERSRRMIEAIKKTGGSPKYTELPGVGHDSWTAAYTDPKGVIPWMFEQVKK
ncbi:MAG: carboxylesterase family protein [Pirellulales bacterium]